MSLTPLAIALAALIALLGIAQQWGAGADFPGWQLGVLLLLLGLAYEWRRARRYRLTATAHAEPLRLGRPEQLQLTLRNGERRPLTLEFAPGLPADIAVAEAPQSLRLPARGEARHAFRVHALQLGRLPWPHLPARVKGPLGLAWWRKPQPLDMELRVVPDLLRHPGKGAGLALAGPNRRPRSGDGPEFERLREYRIGDPKHAIDWKASARSSSLVTRVTREDQRLSIMLVVDAGRTSRTRVDGLSQLAHYVNLCARFAELAVAGNDQVGLVAAADRPLARLAPAWGPPAVAAIRAALSGLNTQAVETDLVAAALQVRQLARRRCLILLLTDLYGQSGSGQLMRSIRLWSPKHLPVVVGLVAEELHALAAAEAKDWLDPYIALATADHRRNLTAAASGLRRLGARPLIARAATLETQVLDQYRALKQQRRV